MHEEATCARSARIRLAQRGSVVDAIPAHAHNVAPALEATHQLELALGQHAGERAAIECDAAIVFGQLVRRAHVADNAHLRSHTSRGERIVARYHDDAHTRVAAGAGDRLGILANRVLEPEQPNQAKLRSVVGRDASMSATPSPAPLRGHDRGGERDELCVDGLAAVRRAASKHGRRLDVPGLTADCDEFAAFGSNCERTDAAAAPTGVRNP